MIESHRIPQTPYPLPVILDVSGPNGLGVIQGLARHGLKSLTLDHRPNPIGFASRYATGLTCPDPGVAPVEFGEFLLALGHKLPRKGVLLVTHDTYLSEIAQREEQLTPYFHFCAPLWPILQQVMDKKVQYKTALAQGIAVPKTFFLDDTSLNEIDPASLHWPAILKARSGKSLSRAIGRQVIVVDSLKETQIAYQAFKDFDLMLQEIIPGKDDQLYTFGSCLGRSGELLASFTGRKLRQHPAGFGTAIAAESLDLPGLVEQGTRLLRALDFFGPSQVEFKRDAEDGLYKLVEINARFWKWHSLATACGANVAYATYCDAIGRSLEPQATQKGRKVWLAAIDDLVMTAQQVRRGEYSLQQWRRTAKIPWVDGVFSWRDPLPGLWLVRNFLQNALSRLREQRRNAHSRGEPQRLGRTTGVTEAIARFNARQSNQQSDNQ